MTALTHDNPTSPTLAALRGVFAESFLVKEELGVADWADKHRVIIGKGQAESGQWKTSRAPYLREVMNAYSRPSVREIVIIKPEQVGGTEAVLNMALWGIANRPRPAFWVWSNRDNAADANVQRFQPACKACPPVAAQMSERKSDARSLDVSFLNGAVFRFRGSPIAERGKATLESWPAGDLFNDELDRCDSSTPDMMRGRTTTFEKTYKLVYLGTPEDEGHGIHERYLLCRSRLAYYVPCPAWAFGCGKFFVRSFSGVKWLPDAHTGRLLDADPAVVAKTAWYECPHCRMAISAVHSEKMLAAGVWAPAPEEGTDASEHELPSEEEREKALSAPSVGFWIGPFEKLPFVSNPYGLIASEYVRNGGVETRNWRTRRCGQPWREGGERLQTHELLKLCRPVAEGGYRFGTVPRSSVVLVGAMDVQKDRVYVVVRAYTPRMRRSWLVWAGCEWFAREGGIRENVDVVKEIMSRQYAGEGSHGVGEVTESGSHGVTKAGSLWRCKAWGLDSGWETNDVYGVVDRLGGRSARYDDGMRFECFAMKGRPGDAADMADSETGTKLRWLETDAAGKKLPAGGQSLGLITFNTWRFSDFLMERVRGGAGTTDVAIGEGEEYFVNGLDVAPTMGPCLFGWPEATVEQGVPNARTTHERLRQYFVSLTSEERRIIVDARGNRKRVWVVRTGRERELAGEEGAADTLAIGNHYLDTDRMNLALAVQRQAWKVERPMGIVIPAGVAAGGEKIEEKKRAEGPREDRGGRVDTSDYWKNRRRTR